MGFQQLARAAVELANAEYFPFWGSRGREEVEVGHGALF